MSEPVTSIKGYLDPTVRDRLINYYATDSVYYAVQHTLSIPNLLEKIAAIDQISQYLESIKWYDDVSEEIYKVISRSDVLVETADSLQGKILSVYFDKVTGLVSNHDTLIWLAQPSIVSSLDDLQRRSDGISAVSDLVNSTTVENRQRLSMLQQYLGDDWYVKITGLVEEKSEIDSIVNWLSYATRTKLDSITSWLSDATRTKLDSVISWLNDATKLELDSVMSWWNDTVRADLDDLISWKPELSDLTSWFTSGVKSDLNELVNRRPQLVDLAGWRALIQDSLSGVFHKTGGRVLEVGKDALGNSLLAVFQGDWLELSSDTREMFSFQTANLGPDGNLRSFNLFTEQFGTENFVSGRFTGALSIDRGLFLADADRFFLGGINPFDLLDHLGNRRIMSNVRDRLQDRLNGVLADRIIVPASEPEKPWIKGMLWVQFPSSPIYQTYIRIFDGSEWKIIA